MYTPDEGAEITIDGQTFRSLTPIESVRHGIAVTYQDFSLFPNLSVAENISISGEIEKNTSVLNWKEIRATAKAALDKVGLPLNLDTRLGSLSTAKQQMVAIARALVYNAKLLILDEPTSTLSANEVQALFAVIKNLKSQGLSILFISHKIDEVFAISDRITVLRDGTFIGTEDVSETTPNAIIEKMVGRSVQYERNAVDNSFDEVVLQVEHLSKQGNYHDISFALKKGEILAFTGLVGAGRTELCQSLYGITRPDSGKIIFRGKEVVIKNSEHATRLGIAFVPEDRRTQGLVTRKTVADNISFSILDRLTNKLGLLRKSAERKVAVEFIDRLRIKPPLPGLIAGNLSGGNQQRVVIAKCLATQPAVLIIDEPTNGIDIGAKQEIHELLKNLSVQGMSIIMISSELPEVLAISNRVLVMRRGRIVDQFDGDKATQSGIMHKAIL